MSEISPLTATTSVRTTAGATATTATTSSTTISFPQTDDDFYESQNAKRESLSFINAHKNEMELDDSWYHFALGEDNIKFTPKSKITYGQLRAQLHIPPKVLSKTNGKKLNDNQVIKGSVRINLTDIGWYPQSGLTAEDQAVNRNLRQNGCYVAGYDRAVKDKDIINILNN